MQPTTKPLLWSLNYIPPPFFWHKYGNRQTFPRPTANPTVASMYSSLLPHPFFFPSSTSTCDSLSVLPFVSWPAMACSSFDGEVTVTVICPFCSLFSVIFLALLRHVRCKLLDLPPLECQLGVNIFNILHLDSNHADYPCFKSIEFPKQSSKRAEQKCASVASNLQSNLQSSTSLEKQKTTLTLILNVNQNITTGFSMAFFFRSGRGDENLIR